MCMTTLWNVHVLVDQTGFFFVSSAANSVERTTSIIQNLFTGR